MPDFKKLSDLTEDYRAQRKNYLEDHIMNAHLERFAKGESNAQKAAAKEAGKELTNPSPEEYAKYVNGPQILERLKADHPERAGQLQFLDAALAEIEKDADLKSDEFKGKTFTGALLCMRNVIKRHQEKGLSKLYTTADNSDLFKAIETALGLGKDNQFTPEQERQALSAFESHFRKQVMSKDSTKYLTDSKCAYFDALPDVPTFHKKLNKLIGNTTDLKLDAAAKRTRADEEAKAKAEGTGSKKSSWFFFGGGSEQSASALEAAPAADADQKQVTTLK